MLSYSVGITLPRRAAICTESQIPESRRYMDVYLNDEITPALARMGFKTEILPNPVEGVGPILLAERTEGPTLPTSISGSEHAEILPMQSLL